MADILNYSNYTVMAANTPAQVGLGPVRIGSIIITGTITGSVTLSDSTSTASGTPLLFSAATPAAGTIFQLNLRCKNGAWVVPGTAGTCIVTWEPGSS